MKEIDLHVNIATHDLETKLRAAKKFLSEHHSLVIKVLFRKRENAHPELGMELLEKIARDLGDISTASSPKKSGTIAILRLTPKSQQKQKKHEDLIQK